MKFFFKKALILFAFSFFLAKFSLAQNVADLCTKDFYKRGNGLNPLIMSMKRTLSSVPEKNLTTTSKHLWTKGYVSNQVYRNGYEIYDLYAELIQMAEHEVLIEAMLFDINSPGARKIKEAIALLHEKRRKAGATKPVTVRFVWDIIGSVKGLNLFELMTKIKFHGRRAGTLFSQGKDTGDYQIGFPMKLDPKYVRLELKAHRHKSATAVNHGKGIVIDRKIAAVTGSNIVNYHFTDEKNPGDRELMVDHAFLIYGKGALSIADEFYNLWHKKKGSDGKTTQYNGNVTADKKYKWDGQHFGKVNISSAPKIVPKRFPPIAAFKATQYPGNAKFEKYPAGYQPPKWLGWSKDEVTLAIVGRDAFGAKRKVKNAVNAQNAAFVGALRHAKNHVNINSPNFNSFDLMDEIFYAVKRGIDVNFLLSKDYQNYNWWAQEAGDNEKAVRHLLRDLNCLRKEKSSIGNFNLRWFVTRGHALSGAKKNGKSFSKWDSRIKTKFFNHNHTKFLSVDNQVAIVGSGNWDEQSWYNSRELNVLIHGHNITKSLCQKVFKDDYVRAKVIGKPIFKKSIACDMKKYKKNEKARLDRMRKRSWVRQITK
jgi:phosphatidylserine/phosphatidylglycerophosphate/cardiolipin synthase-like enzyme